MAAVWIPSEADQLSNRFYPKHPISSKILTLKSETIRITLKL
jgi:hypothetical protein